MSNKIDETVEFAIENGIAHKVCERVLENGLMHVYDGKPYYNFESCDYTNLGYHPYIIEGAKKGAEKGIHNSNSIATTRPPEYDKIIKKFDMMFEGYTLLFTKTHLLHSSILKLLTTKDTAILFDKTVHDSVQGYLNLTGAKEIVRVEHINDHYTENNRKKIQKVKNTIADNCKKFERVIYALDGVFSMDGHVPPIDELEKWLDEFPNLYLYIDDAHGTSWVGEYGRGYVLDKFKIRSKRLFMFLFF